MIGLLWLLLVVYVLGLFWAILIWAKKDPFTHDDPKGLKVTVIVPFRNEELHLPDLIKALATQHYPDLEVIWVNDHSTDKSVEVLKEQLAKFPFPSKILQLNVEQGKKAALALGISKARGEIMLTTDADCTMGEAWVQEMIRPFADDNVQVVAGPVELKGKSLFQRWQKMEFATLIALGAVSIRKGKPTMANGANLAYRKSTFQQVNGFEGIDQSPSGDDELLMMKINKARPGSIAFRKSREAMVATAAPKNWSAFKNQRLRWASKWKMGKRPATAYLASFVFILNLCWALLPFAVIGGIASSDDAVLIYSIRFIIEAIWVMAVATFFDSAISVRCFILHQYLYPFYVIYFGLMANFGNYQWKGRRYALRVQ